VSHGIYSITGARLAMLPFAALIWLTMWSLRFLPTPIKNPLKRIIIQIFLVVTLGGSVIVQMLLYKSLSGIRVLGNDRFFNVASYMESIIAICLLFASAFERRRKEKEARRGE
jgi:uncharacterized membrane protein